MRRLFSGYNLLRVDHPGSYKSSSLDSRSTFPMKLFVTGGAGFIGSNFIRHALASSNRYSIVNYDALTYAGNLANLNAVANDPRYAFTKGNICDSASVERSMAGCDAVVHFAAESHVDRTNDQPAPAIETNVTGTFALLQAARKLKIARFVHISSDEVYGDIPSEEVADENALLHPSSPYSASKAAADLLVLSFVRTYGFPAMITRSSNNYGPCQFPEKFLPLMITNALAGRQLPIYGDGKQKRSWLHVEDNCRAILAVVERGRIGEIYNVGGPDVTENLSLARLLLRLMDKPESLLSFVADRPGHDRRYALNSAKIARQLGWHPTIALEHGLRATIDWYRTNTEWLAGVRAAPSGS